MAEVMVVARKWGNSIGITLPKETADREKIRESDRLIIVVKKVTSLNELFGTFKTQKTTQEIKDESRKGWG
ncbi:MAG: AbrB/MazE/SpoVT family DNA-binding domain-containing protein [Candidatus Diapherotrites archaeon]|nr:AbrB/MazE/SpoVT family DNA-binding domain-containing protein [Candidatus Diapherotrites archaeon]